MISCTFENGNVASPGLRHITVPVIVYKSNQVLLGLRGSKNGKPILESGKWGLLGGFFDRDETLVDAAHREVMEESGWTIKEPYLFVINDSPDRPMEDRQNVDMIFVAEADQQISSHDEEVKELRWFDLDNLPPDDEIAFDHALTLKLYKKHCLNPLNLPIFGYGAVE
jgi:ADP-ribose pyrophosphatase YjhB (NUDIX family)